jgi:hypothetical protein
MGLRGQHWLIHLAILKSVALYVSLDRFLVPPNRQTKQLRYPNRAFALDETDHLGTGYFGEIGAISLFSGYSGSPPEFPLKLLTPILNCR